MEFRISKAGLESLQKQLEDTRQKYQDLQVYKGTVAIHSGDAWHDNNDFEQCEIDERRLQRQISDLESQIKSAIIIDDGSNKNVVGYGALVTIQLTLKGEEFPEEVIILFSDSVESAEFMTASVNSPLGSVIYQKEVGFTGSYKVNNNTFYVKILKIEY